MRLSLPFVMLFALVTASSSFAQSHEVSQLNSCIREFYDPEMYKLLTFKNTCAQSLSIMFFAKDGSGVSGTMELRAGGKDSVGRSPDKKIPKIGSFELYVCPAGNVAVDDNNQVVSKPASSFHCRSKSQ